MSAFLRFNFEGLHPEVPELCGDLDWLLRLVAADFEIRVGDELLYEEIEFPVLELAQALDLWMARDIGARRPLEYEVTGSEGRTLRFAYHEGGWLVDSDHRPSRSDGSQRVAEYQMLAGVRSFIAALSREVERAYGYDVDSLLGRLRADAPG